MVQISKGQRLNIIYVQQDVEYSKQDLLLAKANLEKVIRYIWLMLDQKETDSR